MTTVVRPVWNHVEAVSVRQTIVNAVSFGRLCTTVCKPPTRAESAMFNGTTFEIPDPPPTCAICIDSVNTDASLTSCGHYFCTECIELHIQTRRADAMCPMCRHQIVARSIARTAREFPEGEQGRGDEEYLSAKAAQILNDVRRWISEGKKIILFTDQANSVELIGLVLKADGIEFNTVTGSTPVSRRNRIFSEFQGKDTPASKVLVTTMKCASAGINLTRADVLATVTPALAKSTIEQIIGRSRRLGRTADVLFVEYISTHGSGVTVETKTVDRREMHSTISPYDLMTSLGF